MNLERPKIIGVAGGSCCGKTTLAQELRQIYCDRITSILFDDYFLGMERVRDWNVTDWESPNLYNFFTLANDLERISKGQEVTIECHSRESVAAGISQRSIIPTPLVVIEGFLLFHDPRVRSYLNLKVFINLPEDIMLSRRLSRINSSDGWDDPKYITEKLIPGHRQWVLPQREYADLILDSTKPMAESVSRVRALLDQLT